MYTEKRIVAGSLLTGSAAVYYTVVAPVLKTIVKEMTFCNVDTVAHTFTVYIVPTGGTASDANAEFKNIVIQAGETFIVGRTCVMETGATIQALADTGSVISFSCSGVERT
jgi:hypothetical protein